MSNADAATCIAGACDYDVCAPGAGDCDAARTNGCETPLPKPNSVGDTCDAPCAPGYLDCDGVASDGCETAVPPELHAIGVTCSNGVFEYAACDAGFADCDDVEGNGCELEIAVACAGLANVTGVTFTCGVGCSYGACVPGFWDCNATAADGCEVEGTACPVQLSALTAAWLAVDDTNVYFSNDPDPYDLLGSSTIQQVPLGGGPTTALVSGEQAAGLAVDATHVYWARPDAAGGVRRIPKGGGPVEVLADASASPTFFLALGPDDVYFTTWGSARSVPKIGGPWVAIGVGT